MKELSNISKLELQTLSQVEKLSSINSSGSEMPTYKQAPSLQNTDFKAKLRYT